MAKIDVLSDWLSGDSLDLSQLGERFVDLDRKLTESDSKEELKWHIDLTWRFLQKVIQRLREASEEELRPFLPTIFGALVTILVEAGPYRYETYTKEDTEVDRTWGQQIREEILPAMKGLREAADDALEIYFDREAFAELKDHIQKEIIPLVRGSVDRYMPFRVLQACRLADKMFDFTLRTDNQELKDLLVKMHALKYPRFGTSGIRGLWGKDFVEEKVRRVTQAICDYIKGKDVPSYVKSEDLGDKWVVVGYDSREHANEVAEWVAQVCVLNGLKVYLAERDSPTPALIYWAIEWLGEENVSGVINCTASHNPVEWQGIKFSPHSGCPAPTLLTDLIAARANQIQLLGKTFPRVNLDRAIKENKVKKFDPLRAHCHWLLSSGLGDSRIKLDIEAIRNYFSDKKVIIDEMHGAGRDYLRRILDQLGISYEVLHGEINPKFGNLEYANPEEPFLGELKQRVKVTGAALGIALDADADRYGVVDKGGNYFRPNQILPMLTIYLGNYKGLKGKIVRTLTTSRAVDAAARSIDENAEFQPDPQVLPSYVKHPFYEVVVGQKEDLVDLPSYVTMVGIKYVIADGMQADRFYRMQDDPAFRDSIIIGGEESASITTKGHLPDKDGIWANLLIIDMIAAYQKSLSEIWSDFMAEYGKFYGDRVDVDAVDDAKEKLINCFLDSYRGLTPEELHIKRIAGLRVVYLGGVRYDLVEIHLEDDETKEQSFLAIRASGTEPLNRIYTDSSSAEKRREIEAEVLSKLEYLSVELVSNAYSDWRLVDILMATEPSTRLVNATLDKIRKLSQGEEREAILARILDKLKSTLAIAELRSRKMGEKWLSILTSLLQEP